MQHYQQLDFQSLIDLLAKETEHYTKALGNGKQGDIAKHKESIDALVVEITRRKTHDMSPGKGAASMQGDFLGLSS